MPFDESEQRVFERMTRPLDRFRSALAATIEELRDAHEQDERDREEAGAPRDLGLGSFAAGRIDLDRFEAVARREQVALEPRAIPRLDGAFHALLELAARKEQLYRVNVEPGSSLHHAVTRAYAEVGRAFGASRVAALARTNRYREDEHAAWLGSFPFSRWNRSERNMAPPLVVRVDGMDLRAECLAEFLDGRAKIAVLVRGETPPAPLVRLVSPGVYVAQVASEDELEGFARFDGPGVAAVVPEGAARFVHDPSAGATLAERLRVDAVPDTVPDRPLGGASVFQLNEPLRQLGALLERGAVAAAGKGGSEDVAGKLAAWLLGQADLEGLETAQSA